MKLKMRLIRSLVSLLLVCLCIIYTCENAFAMSGVALNNEIDSEDLDVQKVIEAEKTTETTEEGVISESSDRFTESVVLSEAREKENSWNGVDISSIYETDEYRVTFLLVNVWDGGYDARIKIDNLGLVAIENWMLGFAYEGKFSNIWNAKVKEEKEGQFVIKNVGWNNTIAPNSSVEFGFSENNSFKGFPAEYRMLGSIIVEKANDYEIKYELNSDWDEGYSATLDITNKSKEELDNWYIEFRFAREIDTIWNGTVEKHDEDLYRIKCADYNSTIMPGESVSIGFNGHGGSGDDIPIDFVVASKKIGNDINVDDELVKSVYSKLQIGFAEGDSCLAVTNNIELPQNIDGADIEWVTDNEAVISKEGYVTRDYNETKCIKLVAKISKNETILNKEFEVRVIKSMYEDYSIDDIIILDEFEQLYFYNDIIEDLQIFKNKLGYLDFVIGSISDIQVECFNEARLAIYGIKDLVGIDSIDEELKCEGIDKDESGYVYKFTQVYNGIPIYGSVITLLTDLDGNVVGFNSSYIPININTTADVSGENALNKSGIEYQEFKSAELVIYIDDAEPKLSWNITYTNSSGNSCNAVVDANTAEPYIVNPLSSQIAASGKDENGIKRDFNVEYDSDEEFYVMHDYRRDITVYDLNNNINAGDYRDNEIRQINPPINSYSNDWSDDSIAVGTYVNAIKCFDYYKDTFGRNGFFLAARPIDLYINWNNYNAEYNTSTKRNLVFGKPVDDAKSWGASLQTVAHEYTHGIIDAMTDLDKNYISEAGAINEAYADAMSMIISNNTTWQVRLPKGELERDCITPSNSECPSVYSKCIEYDPDSKGTHKNSTVLSHAFYFMNSRGIGNSRLARLLYKSLLISYSEYARFTDVRKNCLLAANALGMSDFEKRIIEEAFDEVEVKLEPSTIITSDNYVTGKVVALNPGANSGDYLKLDNVKVSIRRNNNVSDYCEPVYTDNGMYKILNVLPGTYNLTFEKEGYLPTTLRISIIYREDIYLDSVEMIPSIYSGYGIAEGTVVDAVTGKGVPGLTLNLRSGLGANKGVILQTITTDDNGKYTTDSYITGHYTIEVVDKRDGVAINEKYCTAYKNINIVGKMIMRNQDIPVTTRLNAGQMRIVLEWGENPRDLDSHLLGIDCNGKERFHTYYSKKKYVNNGVTEVELDLDDVTSYGPETTTIYKKSDNKYVFYVYHYSGSGSLSTSNAIVKVYIGTGSTAKYTFNVPNDGGNGRYWTVFEYDGKTGKVSSVNIVGNSVAK